MALVVYADLVFLLNFLVDFLLLLGTNRLAGHPCNWLRCAFSALMGGVYAAACMVPGLRFLGNTLWQTVSLILMSFTAFGFRRSSLRRGVLFLLLSMALGGIALGLGSGDFTALIGAAAGVFALCAVGFRGRAGQAEYADLELLHGKKRQKLIALRDTGNTLKDPLTGQQVLVVGPDVAFHMMGLTREQLSDPIRTIQNHPDSGFRLIPYRAVGQSAGMLLAARFDEIKLDGHRCGCLVAFAPEVLGRGEGYQALAGGVL